MPEETYSNPIAPQDDSNTSKGRHPALRNEDFRKLLATPRVVGSTTTEKKPSQKKDRHSFTHRTAAPNTEIIDRNATASKQKKPGFFGGHHGKFKKKPIIASSGTKNIEEEDEYDEALTDILKNYRDRAAERRFGESKSSGVPTEAELLQLAGAYRAVPADSRTMMNALERRKQVIQESKYLGGDMEHTHLVKGLDYSLLQKVRSEIETKEQEEEQLEMAFQSAKDEREEIEANMKTPLARNIYRFLFKDETPKYNELFAPRRMAYVVALDEDEDDEVDIPTTLMRSKQECPANDANSNLDTNDVVIQKLTQVLSYLRADTKRKKRDKEVFVEQRAKPTSKDIFDDVDEYIPNLRKSVATTAKEKSRDSYFDSTRRDKDGGKNIKERESKRKDERRGHSREREHRKEKVEKRLNSVNEQNDSCLAQGFSPADLALRKQAEGNVPKEILKKGMGSAIRRDADANGEGMRARTKGDIRLTATDSYAECYPGGIEMFEAAGESDNDADFSQMDLGANRKGPTKRWDFETNNDYESFQSKKEAMPKAAYQFGVKMNDGRKTRRTGPIGQTTGSSNRDAKHKMDRQWDQISRLLEKRKDVPISGVATKRIKY